MSHLGFLSIPALRGNIDSPIPRLVALENDSERFVQDLEALDKLRNIFIKKLAGIIRFRANVEGGTLCSKKIRGPPFIPVGYELTFL